MWEPVLGQENLHGYPQITGGTVWTSLKVKNSRAPVLTMLLHTFVMLPPGAPRGSHNEDQKKIPSFPVGGEETLPY